MNKKPHILAICGSASANSGNLTILNFLAELKKDDWNFEIIPDLSVYPHFNPARTDENVPEEIMALRNKISSSQGVIICTPEYVFSIPSGLKNIIEWCVSTTVFSDKPVGLITASAHGKKAQEELHLIMQTIQAKLSDEANLLIQGIKGKVDREGEIIDEGSILELKTFARAFNALLLFN